MKTEEQIREAKGYTQTLLGLNDSPINVAFELPFLTSRKRARLLHKLDIFNWILGEEVNEKSNKEEPQVIPPDQSKFLDSPKTIYFQILDLFQQNPDKEFRGREISQTIGLEHNSRINKILRTLGQEGKISLVRIDKNANVYKLTNEMPTKNKNDV